MSYSPHTWVDGELLTAPKMNAIEQGIVGAETAANGEIADLKSALDEKFNAYTNVDFSIDDKRVNTNGTFVTQIGCCRTDYYPCKPGTTVKWYGESFIYGGSPIISLIAFYDKNKTFISSITTIESETVDKVGTVSVVAPANTAFVIGCSGKWNTNVWYLHVFDVEADIESLHEQIYEDATTTWEIGSLSNTGESLVSTTRIKSDYIYAIKGSKIASPGNQIGLFYYDLDKKISSKNYWYIDSTTVEQTGYIKLLMRKSDDRTITDAIMEEMIDDTSIKLIIDSPAIGAVNDRQNYIRDFTESDVAYGTLIDGKPSSSSSRLYTLAYMPVKVGDYIDFDISYSSNIRYEVEYYNYNLIYTSGTGWLNLPRYSISNDGYIRILFGTVDYSAIDESDVDDIVGTVTYTSNGKNQIDTLGSAVINLAEYEFPYDETYNYQAKVLQFAGLFKTVEDADSFVFFTDPHLLENGDIDSFYDKFRNYTGVIKGFFDRTSTEFILCGGDWLEWDDTPENALYKLNIMHGRMKEIAPGNYYPVFGNHDNNYQGTEALSQDAINATMFPDHENAYYKFVRTHFTGYVLDTGTDFSTAMTPYRWTQVDWFANRLLEDDAAHSAVFAHILWNVNADTDITPLMDNVQKVIGAYNAHSTITLNGTTYNFTNCSGSVGFVLGGHLHTNRSDVTNYAVPFIARTTTKATVSFPTFDLVLADWGNNKLYFIGIGASAQASAEEFTID